MELINSTPYQAMLFGDPTPGRVFHVLLLKACFEPGPDGMMRPAADPSPIVLMDAYAGEPGYSSPIAESELAPYKPRCDVVATGEAHAPGSRPRRSFVVALRLRDSMGATLAEQNLRVHGPREFRKKRLPVRLLHGLIRIATLGLVRPNPWKLTAASAIQSLPLRYETSYGGFIRIEDSDPEALRVPAHARLKGPERRALQAAAPSSGGVMCLQACLANPAGAGFAPSWWLKHTKARRLQAPQIEAMATPLTAKTFWKASRGKLSPGDPALAPQGFSWIAKNWSGRCQHLAKPADRRGERPAPAEDASMAFWNAAPLTLQAPIPGGDEWLECVNLLPEGSPLQRRDGRGNNIFRCRLPGLRFECRLADGQGSQAIRMRLDTIHLDLTAPERPRLNLVYRAVFPRKSGLTVCEVRPV